MSSFTWFIVKKWRAFPDQETRKFFREEDALAWAKLDNEVWDVITVQKEITDTIDILTILAQTDGEGTVRDMNKEYLCQKIK